MGEEETAGLVVSSSGTQSPSMELMYATPATAMERLANSDVNRRLSRPRSIHLADAFRRGEHRLTGDAVELNTDGKLTNGQHRMLGIIIADVKAGGRALDGRLYTDVYPEYPVIGEYIGMPFWFMHNAPSDETLVRDTGRPRNFIDHLKMLGVPSASYTAQVTRLRYQYDRGVLADVKRWQGRLAPTNIELMSFYDSADVKIRVVEAVRVADRTRRIVKMSLPPLAVAWDVLKAVDEEDAQAFFQEMKLDSESTSGAVNSLLKSTHQQRRPRRGQTGWVSPWDSRHSLALIFKTWNHYRAGTAPGLLSFKSGGANPEEFPVPQ